MIYGIILIVVSIVMTYLKPDMAYSCLAGAAGGGYLIGDWLMKRKVRHILEEQEVKTPKGPLMVMLDDKILLERERCLKCKVKMCLFLVTRDEAIAFCHYQMNLVTPDDRCEELYHMLMKGSEDAVNRFNNHSFQRFGFTLEIA